MDAKRELIVERVLRCVELVPRGRVASYGTIGAICLVGARQVGQIMGTYGLNVPWWRITDANGNLPADLLQRARPMWQAEQIAIKTNGLGCRYSDYAADAEDLERQWREVVAELPDHGDVDSQPLRSR